MRKRMPGQGSVYQTRTKRPDGSYRKRWVAQLSVGPRGAATQYRRYAPWQDNTRRKASELLEKMLAERKAPDGRMTFGEYLPRWLARYVARSRIGPSQAANAAAIVRLHLGPVLHDVRLVDLRPSTVEAVLARTGAARRPSTVRHVYNLLALAVDDARKDGLVTVNAVRDVDPPSVPKVRKPPWTLAQVGRFLAAAKGDWYEALYILAAATGLRQGELLGLAWSDVDLDAQTVTVGLQLARRLDPKGRMRYVRIPPKGNKPPRVVDVPASAIEALREHRKRAIVPLEDGLVFVTEAGRPVNMSVPTHRLHAIATAAGLPSSDFHGFRRFRASLASVLSIDPTVTQGQLGHANVSTTLGVYTYANPEQGRAAAAAVDEALRASRDRAPDDPVRNVL